MLEQSSGERRRTLELLTLKFGELAKAFGPRIAAASEADLQRWSERLLSAGSLADVFES